MSCDEIDALAQKTATETSLARTRIDKLRDEMLARMSDEADKRTDSIKMIEVGVASDLKAFHGEMDSKIAAFKAKEEAHLLDLHEVLYTRFMLSERVLLTL